MGVRIKKLNDCLRWFGRPVRSRTGKMPVPPM